jgi:S-DNA-T family DNA segregation ATPase FtsK/SpoIIIE
MAEDGIVGQYNGSQAREVMITVEQWEAMSGGGGGAASAPAPTPAQPPRSGRVLTVAPRSQPQIDDEEEEYESEEDEYEEDEAEADEEHDEEDPEEPRVSRRGRESA